MDRIELLLKLPKLVQTERDNEEVSLGEAFGLHTRIREFANLHPDYEAQVCGMVAEKLLGSRPALTLEDMDEFGEDLASEQPLSRKQGPVFTGGVKRRPTGQED